MLYNTLIYSAQALECQLKRCFSGHKSTNNFLKIVTIYNKISKKSSNITIFHRLYDENFPDSERRDWQEVLLLMEKDNRFNAVVASVENQVVGFVTYWTFEDFNYIEHLAVDATQRNNGTGGSLLELVTALQRPVLLEVELPADNVAQRRIRFYEKRGLVYHGEIDYLQPPYGTGKPSVAMGLMTSPSMSTPMVENAIRVLRSEVYRCK